jgi:hypothetical protein
VRSPLLAESTPDDHLLPPRVQERAGGKGLRRLHICVAAMADIVRGGAGQPQPGHELILTRMAKTQSNREFLATLTSKDMA